MRLIVSCLFLFALSTSFAQDRFYSEGPYYNYDYSYDLDDYKRKYPYAKNYSPSFLGLIVGYNFLKAQEVQLGLTYNFAETTTDFGMTSGYQLIYRRSLERELNAVDLEIGVYGLISLGMGVNYNFSNDVSAFGFKPFIGTSIYHFQLLYGYNFIRKKKQEWYQLPKHSLSIRYVLPLKANKQTYFYLPPAPSYDDLKGLNRKHPGRNTRTSGSRYLN
ncbi:MAG: hypothetical protein P8P74_00815 [Crocinitomicaceae bacterium]|nr:hypothetical protein [Crocinitomicaceae bacterium]